MMCNLIIDQPIYFFGSWIIVSTGCLPNSNKPFCYRKEGLARCGKCKKAFYCNAKCQVGNISKIHIEHINNFLIKYIFKGTIDKKLSPDGCSNMSRSYKEITEVTDDAVCVV